MFFSPLGETSTSHLFFSRMHIELSLSMVKHLTEFITEDNMDSYSIEKEVSVFVWSCRQGWFCLLQSFTLLFFGLHLLTFSSQRKCEVVPD